MLWYETCHQNTPEEPSVAKKPSTLQKYVHYEFQHKLSFFAQRGSAGIRDQSFTPNSQVC